MVNLPRAKPLEGQRVGRSIDYRHLVGALKRKPGAFARWVLRDEAFPPGGVPPNVGAVVGPKVRARGLQNHGRLTGAGR